MGKLSIIKCKLYEVKWREQFILILCILIIWPVGLYQMWRYSNWNIVVKCIITIILLFGIFGGVDSLR